jgi:hypothetical protein
MPFSLEDVNREYLALRMGDISKETPIFKSKYTQTTPRR